MVEENSQQEVKQIGKSIMPGEWDVCFKPVLEIVEAIQKRKGEGRPAFLIEVEQEYEKLPEEKKQKKYPVPARGYLVDLYRMGVLFADREIDRFSTYKINEHYTKYSEIFPQVHPGYKLDDKLRCVADTAKTIDFNVLKSMLLSKDLSVLEGENGWMLDGDFRFLNDDTKLGPWKTSLVSMPRTGNSMSRKYLEEITGVVTGSDMHLVITLHGQTMGLRGEQTHEDRVWIAKSHSPIGIRMEDKGWKSSKVILIARNPIDVIPSFCYLMMLASHSIVPDQKFHESFPEAWDRLVRAQIDLQKHYYDNLIKDIRSKDAPFHIIRFEDMRLDAYSSTKDMMKFVLANDDLDDTVCDHQVKKCCKVDATKKAIYKMKSNDGKVNLNKNVGMYTPSLIEYMKEQLGEMMHFFGYASHPTEENPTAFFKFEEEQQTPELLAAHNEYLKWNKEYLEFVIKEGENLKPDGYTHNRQETFRPMGTPDINKALKEIGMQVSLINSEKI